jgi:hypothetical protein
MMPAAVAAAELARGSVGYHSTELQRTRILERLRQGPATRQALEAEAGAGCARKRISELRRKGWRIKTEWADAAAPEGRVRLVAVYRLDEADPRQADLFA